MSVLKALRNKSKFEVFHQFYNVRKNLTELSFRNFGYKGQDQFCNFIIQKEQSFIADLLKEAQKHITTANSIYPNFIWECDLRRKHQDLAIGIMFDLLQELQFLLETISSIDKNKYVRYDDLIWQEIELLRGWRQSDNNIRKQILSKSPDSSNGVTFVSANWPASNFCNVNNNGNANNNNASNSNGVRPDSTGTQNYDKNSSSTLGEGNVIPAFKS